MYHTIGNITLGGRHMGSFSTRMEYCGTVVVAQGLDKVGWNTIGLHEL